MRIFLTILFSILCFLFLNGQSNNDSLIKEVRKSKNYFEIDVKNLFQGFHSSTLLYKRKINFGNLMDLDRISLVRIYVDYDFLLSKDDESVLDDLRDLPSNVRISSSNQDDILRMSSGIGFEKQFFNKRFSHSYGLDLVVELDVVRRDILTESGTTNGDFFRRNSETYDKTQNYGVNPFFSLKYYINSNLSIGIETGVFISYYNNYQDEESYTYNFNPLTGERSNELGGRTIRDKRKGFNSRFNGVRFFNIGYNF